MSGNGSENHGMAADAPFRIAVVPVTPLMQNCSVLVCGATGRAAVVDPGGDVPRILAALDELRAEVEAIWLTHGHFDHIGGAAELADRTGAPVIGPHEEDAWLTSSVEEQAATFGIPGGRSVRPTRWLEDGDVVGFGHVRFLVRHCPGHTPGHVVFLNESARLGLVGDVLFRESIGRTDFPRGDHAQLLGCIAEKLLALPDDFAFVPGHGELSTIGHERRYNPFLKGMGTGIPD